MLQNLYDSVSYDQIIFATFSTTCHHPHIDKFELMHHIIIEMAKTHVQCWLPMTGHKYLASRGADNAQPLSARSIIMNPIEEETHSTCASDYGSDTEDGAPSEPTYQDPARTLGENSSIIGATIGYIQDNFFNCSSPPDYCIAKDLFGRWTRKHLNDIRHLQLCTSTSDNALNALCEPLHRCSPQRLTRFKPQMPEAKSPNDRLLSLFTAAEEARQRALKAYRDLIDFSNYPLCQILSSGLHNIQKPHAALNDFFVSNFEDLSIVGYYISNAMLKGEGELAARYAQIISTIRGTELSLRDKGFERDIVKLQWLSWNPTLVSYHLDEAQPEVDINRAKFEQLRILHQHVSQGCDDNFETMNSIFDLESVFSHEHTRA